MFWRGKKSPKSSPRKHPEKVDAGVRNNALAKLKHDLGDKLIASDPILQLPTDADDLCSSELDVLLMRFLYARQFDLSKATAMVTQYLEWREKAVVQQIIKTVRFPWIRQVKELYPHNYFGVDKLGRPVFIDRVGKCDPKRLLKVACLEHLLAYWVQQYEYLRTVILPACSIRAGRRIEQGVTIVDLSGLGMSHFNSSSRSVLRKLAHITQNYYPEFLGAMVVVNAPAVFGPIWSFAKGLLDERTVAKITLHTSRSTSWKSTIANLIDEDQLPTFLGGTQSDESWMYTKFGPWGDEKILGQLEDRYRDLLPNSFLNLDQQKGDMDSLSLIPLKRTSTMNEEEDSYKQED